MYKYILTYPTSEQGNTEKCSQKWSKQAQLIYYIGKMHYFLSSCMDAIHSVWVEIKIHLDRATYFKTLSSKFYNVPTRPTNALQCLVTTYILVISDICHLNAIHIFLNQTSTKVLLGYQLLQTQYRNFFCSATIELGSNGKQQLFIYLLWIHLQKDIKIRAILSTMPALLL